LKKLISHIFSLCILVVPCNADEIKLLNAPIEAVTAYFSTLTGNTYILEYETEARTTLTTEVKNTFELEQLFYNIIDKLGGAVTQSDEKTFLISAKQSEPETPNEPNSQVNEDIQVRRVNLSNRIEIAVLKDVLRGHPEWNAVNIFGEGEERGSVLAMGQSTIIDEIMSWVETLDALPKKEPEELKKRPLALEETPKSNAANPNKLIAIDLNYADAAEVVESLGKIVSANTSVVSPAIAAHSSGNQILISGDPETISATVEVINQLDRAPRQVYVDAIIAEISEVTAKKLGIQFSTQSGNIGISNVAGVSTPNIGNFANDALLAGAAGGVVAIGGGASKLPDIGVLLTAIQGDTDNRILSTPSIMAAENKQSTILIGQNVPFITGQFSTDSDAGQTPFQTIKREDLGTKLVLKPRIGPQDAITMQIFQEVSRIDQTATGLSDVATVKREIQTVVTAEPGETIAIGGLRVEQEEIAVSKIPFLSDLPIIGGAFRQETTNSVSRNLVIFLRPTLVTDPSSRSQVVDIWVDSTIDELTRYSDEETFFFNHDPVGKRLELRSLRPKLRPLE
jgi:type II secretory pathway component GspD/PulD (secretin)